MHGVSRKFALPPLLDPPPRTEGGLQLAKRWAPARHDECGSTVGGLQLAKRWAPARHDECGSLEIGSRSTERNISEKYQKKNQKNIRKLNFIKNTKPLTTNSDHLTNINISLEICANDSLDGQIGVLALWETYVSENTPICHWKYA